MSLDREALRELQESMERLGQPFPDTMIIRAKIGPKSLVQERIMREVQNVREAQRKWQRESRYLLYGPPVKKSDFLKTTAISTGPGPKLMSPFERVNVRRITNAIDPSLKSAKKTTIDEFSYFYPR